MVLKCAAAALLVSVACMAQWTMLDAHTTASLRGVHSVDGQRAWVSGTGGTVLRTVDGGALWKSCAVPPGAEELDFRAVQAFDEQTAVVMSAGPGGQSRIYRTTDGCASWTLAFTNPDAKGFWDAMRFDGPRFGVLVGDPVDGFFPVFTTSDGGASWQRAVPQIAAKPDQALFAASNSTLLVRGRKFGFVTGGGATDWIEQGKVTPLPLAPGPTAGAFSIARRGGRMVAVGGDYKLPDDRRGVAAWFDGHRWRPSLKPPGGYRSAVEYGPAERAWIAVGPNGTDISRDDGATWERFGDSSGEWNAVSLPFAVGPHGRIGRLP